MPKQERDNRSSDAPACGGIGGAAMVPVNMEMRMSEETAKNDPWRIVILPRGWVWVGKMNRDGDQCTLTEASNIRRWGTEAGLGELAKLGPRPNTKLDPANGAVRFDARAVIATLDTDEALWKK